MVIPGEMELAGSPQWLDSEIICREVSASQFTLCDPEKDARAVHT